MLKTITTALLSSSLLAMPLVASAHSNHCEDTQLDEQMKSLKQEFKSYRQALADEDWAEMSTAREERHHLTAAAGKEQPLKLHDLPATEHPMMMEEYQQGLDQLEGLFGQLAAAEEAKDADRTGELVAHIGKQSKQSHESLRKDCS